MCVCDFAFKMVQNYENTLVFRRYDALENFKMFNLEIVWV